MDGLRREQKRQRRHPGRRGATAWQGQQPRKKVAVADDGDTAPAGAVCPRCKIVPVKVPRTPCIQCRTLDGK